ncbi:MAG: glycosyltransferase family 4 protein [Leptospiraceae bacterium]|nr:glycosyltransferase family 4 protein [Leptospiraceae bacterium]
MDPLRVALDARPLCFPVSGVSRIIHRVIENLDKNRFWFELHAPLAPHPDYDSLLQRSDVEWIQGSGVLSRTGASDFNVRLPKLLRSDRPDVFWGTQQVLPPALSGSVGAVLTFHDFVAYRFPDSMRTLARWQQKSLQRYSIRRADFILANSRQTKNEILKRYKYPAEQIRIAYPGLERPARKKPEVSEEFLDLISEDDARNVASHRRSRNKKSRILPEYMLACSTIEPRKNYGLLLDAYEKYCELGAQEGRTPLGLIIAGRRGWESSELFQRLEEMERRLPGLHWPYQGKGVSEEELDWLYRNCSFFVMPSLYEGFGIPLLDAMGHGKPALVSNLSCFHEIADHRAEYLEPENPESWAYGMLEMQVRVQKRKSASFKLGKEDWTWKETAEVHGRAFEEAARNRP